MPENWKIAGLVALSVVLALDIWARLEPAGVLQNVIAKQPDCVWPDQSYSNNDLTLALHAYIECRQATEQDNQGNDKWAMLQGLSGAAVALFTFFLMRTSNRQWEVGRDQAAAAKAAVEIATQTLRDSRESTVTLRRAYVDLAVIGPEPAGTPQQCMGFRFVPYWQNSGQTPARHAVSRFLPLKIIEVPVPDGELFEVEPLSGEEARVTTIVPGGQRIAPARFIKYADVERMIRKEVRCFAYLRTDYLDQFEGTPPRHTERCLELKIVGPPTNQDAFEWMGYRYQNSDS